MTYAGPPSPPVGPYPGPGYPMAATASPPTPTPVALPWATRADAVFAGILIAALAVLGALAGVLWTNISPHSRGFVVSSSSVIPDETEQLMGADARFLIITAAVGFVAGTLAWRRRSTRGPVVAVALAAGGTLGALITALLGHALSSGHSGGAVNTAITLPITLQARSMIAVEGGVALIVYLVMALFVAADDLGRRPPDRRRTGRHSVAAGGDAQNLGRYGHGAGRAQDGQLTMQQPDLGL